MVVSWLIENRRAMDGRMVASVVQASAREGMYFLEEKNHSVEEGEKSG